MPDPLAATTQRQSCRLVCGCMPTARGLARLASLHGIPNLSQVFSGFAVSSRSVSGLYPASARTTRRHWTIYLCRCWGCRVPKA